MKTMPKTIYLPKDASRSGIAIEWTKTTKRLYIHGWYDSFVGIEGEGMSLREFFDRLGITENDCRKAFHCKIV
jgi:hypothetical protein